MCVRALLVGIDFVVVVTLHSVCVQTPTGGVRGADIFFFLRERNVYTEVVCLHHRCT